MTPTSIIPRGGIGKTKVILLTLPPGGWEKFDALWRAVSESIASAFVNEALNRGEQYPPKPTVESEREKLEATNPS